MPALYVSFYGDVEDMMKSAINRIKDAVPGVRIEKIRPLNTTVIERRNNFIAMARRQLKSFLDGKTGRRNDFWFRPQDDGSVQIIPHFNRKAITRQAIVCTTETAPTVIDTIISQTQNGDYDEHFRIKRTRRKSHEGTSDQNRR